MNRERESQQPFLRPFLTDKDLPSENNTSYLHIALDVRNEVSKEAQRVALPKLLSAERAPGIGSFGALTLAHLVTDIQLATVRSPLHTLTFINGRPGAGKTELSQYIHDYMLHSVDSNLITWEHNGERRAIADGKIVITQPNLPWKRKNLLAAESAMIQSTEEALCQNKHVIDEIPASAEAYVAGKWLGRPLGTRVVEHFLPRARRRRNSQNTDECNIFRAGVIGGLLLQLYAECERIDKKGAQYLEEGQKIADLYGKKVPDCIDEWKVTQRDGATFPQIKQTDLEEWKLLRELKKFGFIFKIPQDEFEFLYDSLVKPLVAQYSLNEKNMRLRFGRTLARTQLMKYTMYSQPHLTGNTPLSQLNMGIFLNNPTLAELSHRTESDAANQKLIARLREQSNRPLEYFERSL